MTPSIITAMTQSPVAVGKQPDRDRGVNQSCGLFRLFYQYNKEQIRGQLLLNTLNTLNTLKTLNTLNTLKTLTLNLIKADSLAVTCCQQAHSSRIQKLVTGPFIKHDFTPYACMGTGLCMMLSIKDILQLTKKLLLQCKENTRGDLCLSKLWKCSN